MTGKPARLLLAGCLWLLAGGVVTGLGLAAYGTLPRVGWLRPVLSLVVFQVADAPFLFLAWTETRRLRWDTQERRQALDQIQKMSKQIGASVEKSITPQRSRVPMQHSGR